MILRAKEALDRGEFLSEFIPVPEDLKIVAGSVGDPDEQKELERKTAENREKYGYGNWYDFCVGAWGTKWDVGGDGQTDIHPDGKILHTTFDSAWSPPIGAYQRLEELGFGVNAMYFEGGMAYAGAYGDGNDEGWLHYESNQTGSTLQWLRHLDTQNQRWYLVWRGGSCQRPCGLLRHATLYDRDEWSRLFYTRSLGPEEGRARSAGMGMGCGWQCVLPRFGPG